VNEAADQVVLVLQEKKAERVALGELSEDFGQILEPKINDDGLDLLKPPLTTLICPMPLIRSRSESPGPHLPLPRPAPLLNLPPTMPCAW